jgi:glycosyltransferase involved in cell wall biosynthesis
MRRIAYCSPINPVESGISDYSEELLPYLGQYFDLTVIVDEGVQPVNRQLSAHLPVERIGRLARLHRRQPFDAIIYHMGNSPAHSSFWESLQTLPGVVVLHDYVLHHLMLWHAVNRRKDIRPYREEMARRYGAAGADVARQMERGQLSDQVFELPLSEGVIERASGLIAHSRYVVDKARSLRRDLRAAVVPMGVPQVAAPDRQQARLALGLAPDAPIWASFGHINPYKRIEQSLRAFARFRAEYPAARYILVGSVSPNYDLPALVRRLGLDAAVIITGYVDGAEFGRYVAAADLCFNGRSPSAGETSASLLRLLGAGRAVLVSDIATFSELPPAVVAHVPVGVDEEATILAYAQRLWSDPALRAAMERNARDYVAAEHTLAGAAAGYASFLADLYGWEPPPASRPPLWSVEAAPAAAPGSLAAPALALRAIGERAAELGLRASDLDLCDRAAIRLGGLL